MKWCSGLLIRDFRLVHFKISINSKLAVFPKLGEMMISNLKRSTDLKEAVRHTRNTTRSTFHVRTGYRHIYVPITSIALTRFRHELDVEATVPSRENSEAAPESTNQTSFPSTGRIIWAGHVAGGLRSAMASRKARATSLPEATIATLAAALITGSVKVRCSLRMPGTETAATHWEPSRRTGWLGWREDTWEWGPRLRRTRSNRGQSQDGEAGTVRSLTRWRMENS